MTDRDKKMGARYLIIIFSVVIGLLTLHVATAKKNVRKKKIRFPVGCVNLGHKFDFYNVIFTPSARRTAQTVYFIHNISKRSVYLHEAGGEDKPYIIHINGEIHPNRWSVLAVTEKKIKFICSNYNKRKKSHRVINCKKALDICEFPRAEFGTNHRGTYWLLFNRSRRSAMRMTRHYGVWLNTNRYPGEE